MGKGEAIKTVPKNKWIKKQIGTNERMSETNLGQPTHFMVKETVWRTSKNEVIWQSFWKWESGLKVLP